MAEIHGLQALLAWEAAEAKATEVWSEGELSCSKEEESHGTDEGGSGGCWGYGGYGIQSWSVW